MVGALHAERQMLNLLKLQVVNEGRSKLDSRFRKVNRSQKTSRAGTERMLRSCSGNDEKTQPVEGERRHNTQQHAQDTKEETTAKHDQGYYQRLPYKGQG